MAASDPNLYAFELIFKGLSESKTPVSKSKIQTITEHAIKAQKFYKHVCMHIEGFIRKSSPKHKLPGIYVIDSILRIARKKGKDRDVFSTRFAKNLSVIFASAAKCVEEDKFKVFRCFKLWKEGHFFPDEIIDPIVQKIAAIESFENVSDGGHRDTDQQDTENKQQSLDVPKSSPLPFRKNVSEEKTSVVIKSDSPVAVVRSPEKARFDKRLLDFDYSDEEEGEAQRGSRRNKKKTAPEKEEDFFVLGKDGKPEFAIDKIMSGLRQSRGFLPISTVAASPDPPSLEVEDEDNEMELSSPGPFDQVEVPPGPPPEPVTEKPVVLKSCTVWIGHLPKGVTEGELKKAMSEYGAVATLDLIPSRGCAYVAYEKRRHAESAIRSRRYFYDLFGDKVKISWGPGRGIKAGYKDWNWDVDTGVCEIKPSLLPAVCRGLAEGCELMLDTVPDKLKARFSDKPEEELKSASHPAVGDANPSPWETTASAGFAPLEAHINTWDALLQLQAQTESLVTGPLPPPLPLAFDQLQPPAPPPFFSNTNLPGLGTPAPSKPQQNGLAIPTITGQTSWTDPVTPKSSLFSKMKSADNEFSDPFAGLLAEQHEPSSINSNTNPLFSKPPPPLGTFSSQTLGPPAFNPAAFLANLQNSPFPGNNMRMPFNGTQNFGPQGIPRVGGIQSERGGPPLPVFRGLGMANIGVRQAPPPSGLMGANVFSGMDLNPQTNSGMGNRFPVPSSQSGGPPNNMGDRFGGSDTKANTAGPHRFAGSDIRLPLLPIGMGHAFGQNRPPFPPNDSWNASLSGPPRLGDGADNGSSDFGRDRRNNFPGDQQQRPDFSRLGDRNFGDSGSRQNFHGNRQNFQNNDNRRNFQDNGRGFDGPRRPPPFQQQRGPPRSEFL